MALQKGFTAVELLITLFVGTLFVLAANQLYGVATSESADARLRIQASTAAYNVVNSYPAPSPCQAKPTDTISVAKYDLPDNATADVTIDCPFNETNLSRLTVKINYRPGMSISHAQYK